MNYLAIGVLIAAVVFLVVAGGGIYPWTTCIAAAALCAACLVWARRGGRQPAQCRGIEAVYVAVLFFFLLALLPLPVSLTRIGGSRRFRQNALVARTLNEASDLGVTPTRRTAFALTRNRAGTMRAALLAIAAFSCILLAATLTDQRRHQYLRFLCLLGGVLGGAACVALQLRPQGNTLWWTMPVPPRVPGPLLCFVNRNHCAGYLAMLCPAALALFFADAASRRFLRALLLLAAHAAMSAAIVLTLSRGAVVAYIAGHVALLAIYAARRRLFPALCLLLAGTVVAVAMFCFSGQTFKHRMATLREPLANGNFDERLDAWRTCGAIWRSYPIMGAGPNAFRMVFPQYRSTSRREYMTHPENEYAQLLAESGLVGTLLFVILVAAILRGTRSPRIPRAAQPDAFLLPAAVGAAAAAAAVHACFDFAPHLPLYAVTLSSMLGLVLATGAQSRTHRSATGHPQSEIVMGRLPRSSLLGLGLLILLSFQCRNMRDLDSPARMTDMDIDRLARAVVWSPTSWQTWFYFGRACWLKAERKAFLLGERCISTAGELDPNNYRLWLELGQLRLKLGKREEARKAFARAKKLRYWVTVPEIELRATTDHGPRTTDR